MKASQSVQVVNEELEHFGRAGSFIGMGEGETEGLYVVKLDGEAEPLAFARSDLKELG